MEFTYAYTVQLYKKELSELWAWMVTPQNVQKHLEIHYNRMQYKIEIGRVLYKISILL